MTQEDPPAAQRFPPLAHADMTPEQREVVDAILSGPRQMPSGRVGGPFQPLLRSPELARRVQDVGAHIRFGSVLPRHLNELAIIMTARHWTSQFEFFVHRRFALEAGLDPAWADAVAGNQRPQGMDPEAAAVYQFVTELLSSGSVSDETFAGVSGRYGDQGVIDLIGAVGYYCLISFVLNVDRLPVPEGAEPPLS